MLTLLLASRSLAIQDFTHLTLGLLRIDVGVADHLPAGAAFVLEGAHERFGFFQGPELGLRMYDVQLVTAADTAKPAYNFGGVESLSCFHLRGVMLGAEIFVGRW